MARAKKKDSFPSSNAMADIDLDPTGQQDDINLESEDQELDDTTPEGGEKKEVPKEDKPVVDWESDENPYKKRYGDSTREIQENLLPKTKQVDKLLEENAALLEKLKAEKPEVFDNVALQKQLKDNTEKLALIQEKSMLDEFVADNPLAKPFRSKLQSLARAFPDKSIADLYNENYKDVAEAKKEDGDKDLQKKRDGQGDKGKGATKEPTDGKIGGYSLDEFNKLPVAKRRQIALENGLKF